MSLLSLLSLGSFGYFGRERSRRRLGNVGNRSKLVVFRRGGRLNFVRRRRLRSALLRRFGVLREAGIDGVGCRVERRHERRLGFDVRSLRGRIVGHRGHVRGLLERLARIRLRFCGVGRGGPFLEQGIEQGVELLLVMRRFERFPDRRFERIECGDQGFVQRERCLVGIARGGRGRLLFVGGFPDGLYVWRPCRLGGLLDAGVVIHEVRERAGEFDGWLE